MIEKQGLLEERSGGFFGSDVVMVIGVIVVM